MHLSSIVCMHQITAIQFKKLHFNFPVKIHFQKRKSMHETCDCIRFERKERKNVTHTRHDFNFIIELTLNFECSCFPNTNAYIKQKYDIECHNFNKQTIWTLNTQCFFFSVLLNGYFESCNLAAQCFRKCDVSNPSMQCNDAWIHNHMNWFFFWFLFYEMNLILSLSLTRRSPCPSLLKWNPVK